MRYFFISGLSTINGNPSISFSAGYECVTYVNKQFFIDYYQKYSGATSVIILNIQEIEKEDYEIFFGQKIENTLNIEIPENATLFKNEVQLNQLKLDLSRQDIFLTGSPIKYPCYGYVCYCDEVKNLSILTFIYPV